MLHIYLFIYYFIIYSFIDTFIRLNTIMYTVFFVFCISLPCIRSSKNVDPQCWTMCYSCPGLSWCRSFRGRFDTNWIARRGGRLWSAVCQTSIRTIPTYIWDGKDGRTKNSSSWAGPLLINYWRKPQRSLIDLASPAAGTVMDSEAAWNFCPHCATYESVQEPPKQRCKGGWVQNTTNERLTDIIDLQKVYIVINTASSTDSISSTCVEF